MQSILALIRSFLKRIAALFARKAAPENNVSPDTDNNDDTPPVLRPDPGPGEVVCYYGCPNSNKAKKLQLKQTAYK